METVKSGQQVDKRWKIIEGQLKLHQYRKDSLIEILHKAQEAFGFLTDEVLTYIANALKLPKSYVYGVVTFYHFFKLKPQGKHVIVLCMGTACYVKGANKIVEYMKEKYDTDLGQTTKDNLVSFMSARCVGACGVAPAAIVDGVLEPYFSIEKLESKIQEWKKENNSQSEN
ncbi:MAG: NAD(P)H-dependent oxidoreductase subunit E [Brevinematales bacterium]|nr:NAD(P)H-dependent oxidoreductase subunit E [Brevinematales bacterium]